VKGSRHLYKSTHRIHLFAIGSMYTYMHIKYKHI